MDGINSGYRQTISSASMNIEEDNHIEGRSSGGEVSSSVHSESGDMSALRGMFSELRSSNPRPRPRHPMSRLQEVSSVNDRAYLHTIRAFRNPCPPPAPLRGSRFFSVRVDERWEWSDWNHRQGQWTAIIFVDNRQVVSFARKEFKDGESHIVTRFKSVDYALSTLANEVFQELDSVREEERFRAIRGSVSRSLFVPGESEEDDVFAVPLEEANTAKKPKKSE